MEISEFKDKVYKRILSQYLKYVRQPKMRLNDRLFFMLANGLPIVTFLAYYYFHTDTTNILNNILRMVGVLSGMFLILPILMICLSIIKNDSLMNYRNIFKYKQMSDKFWGTTLFTLPVLNNIQLNHYLKSTVGWYCKKEYTDEERSNIIKFTQEEMEEMKKISFNQAQKDFILDKVKNNEEINFYTLEEIVNISVKSIENQEKLIKEKEQINILNNKHIKHYQM